MKVDAVNYLDKCPKWCADADIKVDHFFRSDEVANEQSVIAIVDCSHSAVCYKRGDHNGEA